MTAIEKIHSLDKFGSRPGLDRIKRFLSILGDPQDKLSFIHVAGTNGKGSTCQLISSVLVDAGYKTGLFISPYIVDFRERIQINGKMISEKTLENAVERTFPILEKLRDEGCVITEFEYVTALEFLIHSEAQCDVVVLETGMGGLLDCTNVIKPPICSVITVIGLDHTAILGSTLTEIARQKCGIIKSGSVAVTSRQTAEVMSFIEEDCRKKSVMLKKADELEIEVINSGLSGTTFLYNGTLIELPLIGEHQVDNAKTALAALEIAKERFEITNQNISSGFKKARNPARFELLSEAPTVILDGAHNPNGVEALTKAVKRYVKGDGLLILGMLSDKDSITSVKLLGEVFGAVYTVPVDNPRSLKSGELGELCREHFDEVNVYESVYDAFDAAYDRAKRENRPLVIAGSLYLAGEIRDRIISKT